MKKGPILAATLMVAPLSPAFAQEANNVTMTVTSSLWTGGNNETSVIATQTGMSVETCKLAAERISNNHFRDQFERIYLVNAICTTPDGDVHYGKTLLGDADAFRHRKWEGMTWTKNGGPN